MFEQTPVNIWNTHKIDAYLRSFSPDNEVIADLLVLALGKPLKAGRYKSKTGKTTFNVKALAVPPDNSPQWLLQKWNQAAAWHEFFKTQDLDKKVRCVRFWLQQAANTKEPWYLDYLEKGKESRRKPNYPTVWIAVDTALNNIKKSGKYTEFLLSEGEIKINTQCKNGMTVYELITDRAMRQEGKNNANCVGNKLHISAKRTKRNRYFSLRNAAQESLATIKVSTKGIITAIRGPANNPFDKCCDEPLIKFINDNKFELDEDGRCHGFYRHPKDKKIYSRRQLPPGSVIKGSLNLVDYSDAELPPNLTVRGTLTLSGPHCPAIHDSVKASRIVLLWKKNRIFHDDAYLCREGSLPPKLIFNGTTHKIKEAVYVTGAGKKDRHITNEQELSRFQNDLKKQGKRNPNKNVLSASAKPKMEP